MILSAGNHETVTLQLEHSDHMLGILILICFLMACSTAVAQNDISITAGLGIVDTYSSATGE